MNINWGLLLTPDEGVKMKKDGRRLWQLEQARAAFSQWMTALA
jgi:hypothetical protein